MNEERWSPPVEIDMSPYIEYVQELQAEFGRVTRQLADQLLNPGYDPYNKPYAGRIAPYTFTTPQQTRKS